MAITQNTYERRALHKAPRRPFPASEFNPPPHRPVARPAHLVPYHPGFLSFWAWCGKFRLIWFVVELPPALAYAWKQARKHSHVMFPNQDGWLL